MLSFFYYYICFENLCVPKLWMHFLFYLMFLQNDQKQQLELLSAICRYSLIEKHFLSGVFSYCLAWEGFSFIQVLNRMGHAQVFVYCLAGPRDQRGKRCVSMVSNSALPASDTKDSCSLLAFSITPIVSERAQDKQKEPNTKEKQDVSHYIQNISVTYGCLYTDPFIEKSETFLLFRVILHNCIFLICTKHLSLPFLPLQHLKHSILARRTCEQMLALASYVSSAYWAFTEICQMKT